MKKLVYHQVGQSHSGVGTSNTHSSGVWQEKNITYTDMDMVPMQDLK